MTNSQQGSFKQILQKWKPGVGKRWHLVLSGLVWSGAGLMLVNLALGWLRVCERQPALLGSVVGCALAYAIFRFGFSKIAGRNIQRICLMEGKVCVFAFQEWQSYLIMAFMMTLGISLRRSGFSKNLLSPVYIGIGGGLLLSSLRYYVRLRPVTATRFDGAIVESSDTNQP